MATGLHMMAGRPLASGQATTPCRALCIRPAVLGVRVSRPCPIRAAPACARRRIMTCRAAAAVGENPFTHPRALEGLPATLFGMPASGVVALGVALAAALGVGGWTLAVSLLPESLRVIGRLAAAAAGAVLAAVATRRMLALRRGAAVVELHNLLVSLPSAGDLTRDAVAALEARAGAPLSSIDLPALQSIYGTFLESAVPPGATALTGHEAARLLAFKAALGLEDEAAGPVHIDVGRRILRGRLEAGSRREDVEARRAFQKLIYVSYIVFGAERSYLTPWARAFGLTDAQVYVARRDNARALFQAAVDAQGGGLDLGEAALGALRASKDALRLADEEAAGVLRGAARTTLEAHFDRALAVLKHRTRQRDVAEAVAELQAAVAFNRLLGALGAAPGALPGLAPTSVAGSEWAGREGRSRDLRDLFRVAVEAALASPEGWSPAAAGGLDDLRSALGLGPKEAAAVELEAKERAYRAALRGEVTSGRLDAAPSPAAVLGGLVELLGFDPAAAADLHAGLYRQKLAAALDKQRLSAEDDAELARLQRLMCIPAATRDEQHAELCGAIFGKALDAALAAGTERFGAAQREAVRAATADLRLDRGVARAMLAQAGRRYLLQFISNARKTKSHVEGAKELKHMVLFSSVVLSPLVDDLRTEEERTAAREAAEQERRIQEMVLKMQREQAEKARREAAGEPEPASEEQARGEVVDVEVLGADGQPVEVEGDGSAAAGDAAPSSLQKAKAAADSRKGGEVVGDTVVFAQKDITLAEDMDVRDRIDVYRNFLMYCMSGDVSSGPMGVSMIIDRDESEFARLSQLGDVLGLSPAEVSGVHTDMAEQAFRSQVQQAMGEGPLTPERMAGLEAVRQRMGLPKPTADKVLRGFQNQKLIEGMQAAKAAGQLTLPFLLELKEAGVDVVGLTSSDLRLQLYRREALERLTDGTGEFDPEAVVGTLPAALGIDAGKAAKLVRELATDRRRTTLVQAISYLRQKKWAEAVKALNNLLAVERAAPSESPLTWSPAEELADLYSLYVARQEDEVKQQGVQACLGLADAEAAGLRGLVEAGGFQLGQEESESEAAFF